MSCWCAWMPPASASSDIKVLTQGNQHPRILGRDMEREPVILGHEASVTVVAVGENRRGQFRPGDRFIVQADVHYKGKNVAYGYQLPGALEQFGVIPKEMIDGDEGCYLLPVKPETGYAEAALSRAVGVRGRQLPRVAPVDPPSTARCALGGRWTRRSQRARLAA